MTRKCGKCAIPAPDDDALFCNRCGSAIIEEEDPAYPLCPSCGTVVTDELAEFCNRCGTRIPKEPVPLICPGCGREAVDTESMFCTRCGTPFEKKKITHAGRTGAAKSPASVVVKQKKSPATKPRNENPAPEWDPFTDEVAPSFGPTLSPASSHKRYAHLPLDADEPRASDRRPDPQIAIPSKKYAHLPLIADELKDRYARPQEHDRPEEPPTPSGKGRKPPQKKGMMGLFKK